MDRIEKALQRISAKERQRIKLLFVKIARGDFRGFDIKKLKGRNDIFRIRKGMFRIIYSVKNKKIFILSIERRRESTYKF